MVTRHARIRRMRWSWPSESRWRDWAKGRFPGLCAKSVQMVIREFLDTLVGAARARKAERLAGGDVLANYPWRTLRYRDVPYCNQTAKIRSGHLRLTGSKGMPGLRVRLPAGVHLPGRIMEATLSYGVVRISCEVDEVTSPTASTVGVDLGVNTLAAASDGTTAVVVGGHEAKAIQQYRNKRLASIRSRQSKCQKGSRRHKRLQRRKRNHLARCARKQRDLCHKATWAIAKAFPGATVVVGRAFNDAAQKMGRVRAQQVSQACTGQLTRQLSYKLSGARKVSEAYSSQTCPVCGCRQTCRRVYRCKACGLVAPRDVVGAVNIRAIGLYGALTPGQAMPTVVRFVRPLRKYPGPARAAPGSSGGTPASSSEAA